MPFRSNGFNISYGMYYWDIYNIYYGCAPDFSACNTKGSKALVFTSNTSPGCVSQGTCTVQTNVFHQVIVDYSSVGKTALNLYWSLVASNFGMLPDQRIYLDDVWDILLVHSGIMLEYWRYYAPDSAGGLPVESFNPYSSFMAYNVKQYTFHYKILYILSNMQNMKKNL